MYEVKLINSGIETIIHYPDSEKESPHLMNLDLKESLSIAEELSFTILHNNAGYDLVNGLKTRVKVIDTRDDSTIFTGRIIPLKSNMASGKFEKEVTCEGALNYLNDTNTRRWNFQSQTPTQILTYLLNQHNSKVDASRKIYLGIVEVTQAITIDTNYESSLNAIITKLRNILGGDIRVRETNNILYLDYLTDQGGNSSLEISLGYNLKDMVVEYDPMDIVTRVIPLGYGEGINQLTIAKVNNNIDYIQDAAAVAEYGVIEGVPTNKDIQNANTLKIYGQNVLNEKKQIKLAYIISQLDLSVLTGHENEKYNLGDTIQTLCDVMSVDVYARVIVRERDLINDPWNPNLTISTRKITLADQVVELKQRNLNLENCPQGSTFVTVFNANDNLDADHSIKIPIWLSPDIIYVNRVKLYIESQKFRAYEKGMKGGGATTNSTSSGGGSTVTSSSGGGSTATSSSGGGSTVTSESGGSSSPTSSSSPEKTNTSAMSNGLGNKFVNAWKDALGTRLQPDSMGQEYVPVVDNGGQPSIDLWWMSHCHDIDHIHSITTPAHTHYVAIQAHTHNIYLDAHTHNVVIPAHVHEAVIPPHIHQVVIPDHVHEIEYGIFEDTNTLGSKILINGVEVADGPNEGASLDIDISEWVGTPGETYSLEITSTRRGRVAVQVNVQAFIQTK